MKKILLIVTCACLVACSQTLPVNGKFEKTNERFIGTATGNAFGQGSLNVTTEEGVTCQSKFNSAVASSPTEGVTSHGLLTCSDGRTGNFTYSGTARQGNGFGTLSDGHKFIFTYGVVGNLQIQEF